MGHNRPYAFTTLTTFSHLILTIKLKMALPCSSTVDKEGETQESQILPGLGINHLVVRLRGRIKGGVAWKGLGCWDGGKEALSGGLLEEPIYQLVWKDFNISICITTLANATLKGLKRIC